MKMKTTIWNLQIIIAISWGFLVFSLIYSKASGLHFYNAKRFVLFIYEAIVLDDDESLLT